VVQVFATGDENSPIIRHRPHPASSRASIHSNAILTHPVSDLLDGTLWNRELGSLSEDIVITLVQQLFEGIRNYLVQAAEMKFNCFFLMPIIDAFPMELRAELEAAFETNLEAVFDVEAVRQSMI
jgi:hypothetical protein